MKFNPKALTKMRIESGLQQEEMADKMKISQPQYSRLENDLASINAKHISKIAVALGKTEAEVLSQLSGCTVSTTNNDDAQHNQNLSINIVDKESTDEKSEIINTQKQTIDSQKQTIESQSITINILHKRVSELESVLQDKGDKNESK
jgi:transcriptional regulator with XRE-family HTH domain